MNRKRAKTRYICHKSRATQRGILFNLTFEEWDSWWLSHGVDKNLPPPKKNKNTLCCCRYGDQGSYEIGNIYCATVSQNVKDQWANGHSVNSKGRKGKSIQTPKGTFSSKDEATKAYAVDRTTIARWLKKKPKDFYYL